MASLLEIKHIDKRYDTPGEHQVTVLKDIDLKINEGEFVAILGPSGSGKSTLLRIIAGLVKATNGTVSYLGNIVTDTNPGVSMVFQSFALFPWLTVLQNVELGLRYKELTPAEKRTRALEVIDMIGLDGFESAYPKELSGGMKQRVGLGRALVMQPDILLMDEPFSALDVLTAENLRRDLLELWIGRKIPTKSIIMVTHGIEEAVYMADRVVVLSRNPATVISDMRITIPHWRERKDLEFTRMVDLIYGLLTHAREVHETVQEPTPELQKKYIRLPHVVSGALTGFLELLDDLQIKSDLYKLADDLMFELDDFLPIVEAAQLLGFAVVSQGDISLTDVGTKFAGASVLERKELFRAQLRHVPIFERICWVLESKRNRKMPREFFLEIIRKSVGTEPAEEQMETIIDWGRYSELFAYDEAAGVLYMESD